MEGRPWCDFTEQIKAQSLSGSPGKWQGQDPNVGRLTGERSWGDTSSPLCVDSRAAVWLAWGRESPGHQILKEGDRQPGSSREFMRDKSWVLLGINSNKQMSLTL